MKSKALIQALGTLLLAAFVYYILPASCPEPARRTAFIFIVAALFWALEIIPIYATSLLIVLLSIVLCWNPVAPASNPLSDYTTFLSPLASPVIMLFLGGFVLASAVHKYQLDQLAVKHLLKVFGSSPYSVLLGFMGISAFLSMWLSNTATTAMMIGMTLPLYSAFENDDKFKTALVLGIAFGANLGGMGTPIGTPPNAIVVGLLYELGIRITFLSWMKMVVPLVIVLVVTASFILNLLFKSKHEKIELKIECQFKMNFRALAVLAVVLLTITLWLTTGVHGFPAAVVSLLAVGLLAGFQLIGRNDLKGIEWDVLILMWGGLVLGKTMMLSGISEWVLSRNFFSQQGIMLILLFAVFAVFLSSFISNTATANLIIPLAVSIPNTNPTALGIIVALCCSAAMVLPISTPPNAIAYSTDHIRGVDMLRAGSVITIVAAGLVLLEFYFLYPIFFN